MRFHIRQVVDPSSKHSGAGNTTLTQEQPQAATATPTTTLSNCAPQYWDSLKSTVVTPPCTSSPTGQSSPSAPAPTFNPTPTNNPAGSQNLSSSSSFPASVPSGLGSSNTTITPPANNGLKGGAVAGVAIACLIGGAAIAAAIFFVLYRRQKKHQSSAFVQHLPQNGHGFAPGKGPSVTSGPVVVSNVDNLLPLPAEDDAIKKEVSRIRDNIKNHVREYYHVEAVALTDLDESRLQSLAIATGLTTSALMGTFLNPYTRGDAIRLFVAWVMMSRCSGDQLPNLLPDELSGLAIGVGKDGTNTSKAALYSKWKVITGALLQQQYGTQQDRAVPSRSIAEAIAELNAFLAPFVVGSIDGGQRHRNLEMIMSRCANLAFLLFSQPGRFVFDFTSQNGAMTVFPALVQVVGDKAQTLSPPKVFWQKELAAGE